VTAPLLRPRDVARILAISEASVYELVKSKKLIAVTFQAWEPRKSPNRATVRISETSVADFIQANTRRDG